MRLFWMIAAVLAVVLLLYGIGQAYRSDEVWSLQRVGQPWPEMMRDLRADIHPPLYYFLLRGWTCLFGTSELAARSLSALMHLVACLVLLVAARNLFGEGAGAVAAAVLLVSPLGLLVAQFARMYALLELAAALSTALFLNAEKGRWRSAVYIAANVAGSFTHVWFFFLLGAQILLALALRRWKTAAAAGLSVVPYALLWLPVMLSQFTHTGEGLAWLPPPVASDLAGALLMHGGTWWLLAPVIIVVAWRFRASQDRTAYLLFAVWGIAIIVPFILSYAKPVFWARFTVAALPAFALAVAGITRRKDRLPAATLVLLLGTVLQVGQVYSRPELCGSRWTARWLAHNTRPGDLVVYTNLSRLATDFYWDQIQPGRGVLERSFPAEIDSHPGFEGRLDVASLNQEAQLLESPSPGDRIFLLHGSRPQADAALMAHLEGIAVIDSAACVKCSLVTNYYNRISVFHVPVK